MSVTVGIAGVTGYAGGEALRLFLGHPALRSGELAIGPLTGKSSAGRPADEVLPAHPQLAGRVVEETSAEALAGCEAVILCLPHAAGAALTGELSEGPDAPLLIDADGNRIPSAQVPQHLRRARLQRVGIEANGEYCKGLLAARYPAAAH